MDQTELKLSSDKTPEPTPVAPVAPIASAAQDTQAQQDLVKAAEAEYLASGKLSEATYESIAKTHNLSKEHVDIIIEGRKAKAEQETQAKKTDILSVIGGSEQKYQEMTKWAQKAYTSEEVELFDQTLASGNPTAIKQQLKVMQSLYNASQNKPQVNFRANQLSSVGGAEASSGSGDRFRNIDDMRSAMRDPRYHTDVNYTKDLQAKVAKGFTNR